MSVTPPPGYRTQSEDTSYPAERILFERWRTMRIEDKAALVSELCRSLYRLSLAGLAARHPNESREELERRAAALWVGRDLVEAIAKAAPSRP